MANPFAYEEYRKDKIRQKIEASRVQRVQLKVTSLSLFLYLCLFLTTLLFLSLFSLSFSISLMLSLMYALSISHPCLLSK